MKIIAGIMMLLFVVGIFASASMNAYAQEITSIVIEADPDVLLTGQSTDLSAEGFYENGSSAGDVTADTVFTIVDPANISSEVGPTPSPTYTAYIPGIYNVTGEYNGVVSEPIMIIVHSLTVEKSLVSDNWYVPVFTQVQFDLEIMVENPVDGEGVSVENVMVKDGLGAELDLVVQSDGGGDYIFAIDGTPLYFDGDDDEFYGGVDVDVDGFDEVSWKQASDKAFEKGKRCATIVMWNVSGLADGASATLGFSVETNNFTVGKDDKHTKQSYTSTCHHELNDGPEVSYGYPVDESVYTDTVVGEPLIISVYDPNPDEDGVYPDSDGDGFPDVVEVEAGTDPCDPEDYPELVA